MRTIAEVLFWAGRLEIVTLAVVSVHGFVIWHWRHETLTQRLAVAWLLLFAALSVALFPGVLSRALDGIGYVEAHLAGGIWRTDQEALSNILARWQNLWLPIYVPWLGAWLVGLAGVFALSRYAQRLTPKSC